MKAEADLKLLVHQNLSLCAQMQAYKQKLAILADPSPSALLDL